VPDALYEAKPAPKPLESPLPSHAVPRVLPTIVPIVGDAEVQFDVISPDPPNTPTAKLPAGAACALPAVSANSAITPVTELLIPLPLLRAVSDATTYVSEA
jgi:hypothetical protein